jgi:hypothetical protein
MRVGVSIRGDIAALMQDETVETARNLRDGIQNAGRALQAELRQQTASAFPRGRGIASAWKTKVFPENPLTVTFHPAASVSVAAKKKDGSPTTISQIIEAFESGKTITAKRGKYLAWPTSYNATAGRRGAGRRGGVRVTVEEMTAERGQSVIIPSRRRGLALWCLRVRQASSVGGKSGRNRGAVQLYVGGRNIRVATGKIKKGAKAALISDLASRGIIAMYFLAKQVTPGKRLDVEGAAQKADATLPQFIEAALKN